MIKQQYKIAELMHNEYEEHSKKVGWKTQKSCQTLFDELPPANKEVILWVAGSIMKYIKKQIKDVSIYYERDEAGIESDKVYEINKSDLDLIL